jgi:tripartite-type tricarboxylate transporter receptor subunit TctC
MSRRAVNILLSVLFAVPVLMGASWGSKEAGKYPSKNIEAVVPFAPGGSVDVSMRILTAAVEKDLKQKILIVNKAGGGATEGQSYVARAKPDGYTLLAITSSVVTNTITKKVDFTIDSFDPILQYCFDPEILFVTATSPYKTLDDFMAAAKKEPVMNATSGHSTSHHVAGIMLEKLAGIKLTYVHTKGGKEPITMVAGGHVASSFGSYGVTKSLIEQGKIRVLGVMSEKRDPRFPDVPTFKEKRIDISYGPWRGVAAPKGTPQEVMGRLNQAFKSALATDEVKKKFANTDIPIAVLDGKEFAKVIRSDYESQKSILADLATKGPAPGK